MAGPRGVPCSPPDLGQNRPIILPATPIKCIPPKHFDVNSRQYIYVYLMCIEPTKSTTYKSIASGQQLLRRKKREMRGKSFRM